MVLPPPGFFRNAFIEESSQVHKLIRGCKIEEDVYQTGAFLWRGYTLNTWTYSIRYCNELKKSKQTILAPIFYENLENLEKRRLFDGVGAYS